MEPQTNNNEQEGVEKVQKTEEPQTNNEPVQSSEAAGTNETPKQEGEQTQASTTGDMTEYRTFAILGYIIPFLFFLPLLEEKTKNVPYVRFHANQQLILLVIAFGVYVVHNVLYITVMFSYLMLAQLLNLGLLILAIIGIYNAYNGKMKELPFVGQFRILK